jgi:hypothetical protein
MRNNLPIPEHEPKAPAMDVEHINAIGNTLTDLTRRTESLRGYL